jgi:hypothetical protein
LHQAIGRRLLALGVGAVLSVVLIPVGVGALLHSLSTRETIQPSRFVPVAPQKIYDSRPGLGPNDDGVEGAVQAGDSIDVQVAGRGEVPQEAVIAVVLSITVTQALGAGYVQVYPTGLSKLGATSNLNIDYAGQTIANQRQVRRRVPRHPRRVRPQRRRPSRWSPQRPPQW